MPKMHENALLGAAMTFVGRLSNVSEWQHCPVLQHERNARLSKLAIAQVVERRAPLLNPQLCHFRRKFRAEVHHARARYSPCRIRQW